MLRYPLDKASDGIRTGGKLVFEDRYARAVLHLAGAMSSQYPGRPAQNKSNLGRTVALEKIFSLG